MEHYIGVRNDVVWKRAQITLNTRVSLQHRGLLLAVTAIFTSTPNIISQIMLSDYLHHPARSGLLHKRFRFQHLDDKITRLSESGDSLV